MSLKEVIEYMNKKPYTIRMGSGSLSKRLKCSVTTIKEARKIVQGKKVKLPKILVLDIETSPMKAYVWKRWKENISLDQTISEWFCLCWSAKWLFSDTVMSEVLSPEEVKYEDDYRIMKSLWSILDDADIVVTHNGDMFDLPRINSRFIINNMPPVTPYFSIDTCKVCKKQFGFSSNKLDALAGYFGFKHKLDTSFELWKNCMEGDIESLKYMEEYNKQDVILLEEIYLKIRSWIKGHPNIGNYIEDDIMRCSCCGSKNLFEVKSKYYYTSVGKYKLFTCSECGANSRGRFSIKDNKVELVSSGK